MAKKFTCFLTGEVLPKDDMLQFVLSPDGRVVFDPEFRLDGDLILVKDDEALAEKIFNKDFFYKYLKVDVDINMILLQIVRHYYDRMLTFIALAKKSGKLQHGKHQVEELLKSGSDEILLLIQASDASAREKSKNKDILSIEIFESSELSKLLGDRMVKYAIVKAEFAELITKFYNKYIFFKSLNDR